MPDNTLGTVQPAHQKGNSGFNLRQAAWQLRKWNKDGVVGITTKLCAFAAVAGLDYLVPLNIGSDNGNSHNYPLASPTCELGNRTLVLLFKRMPL